jgi:hypothetical protein
MAEDRKPVQTSSGMLANFIFVGGIISLGIMLPQLFVGSQAQKRDAADSQSR